MLRFIYSKFFLIVTLLVVIRYSSNAQSYKQYRNRSDFRLDQRSGERRIHHHDDLRYHQSKKGNRFRQPRHILRNRCVPAVQSRVFRKGFRNGFRLRSDFENRNFRDRGFNKNRWEDRGRRGGRIRSL